MTLPSFAMSCGVAVWLPCLPSSCRVFACHAFAMSWACPGKVFAMCFPCLPWLWPIRCHVFDMSLPVFAMFCNALPCVGAVFAVSLPCLSGCVSRALSLPCHCHVFSGCVSPTLRASYVSHACARAWTPPVECADPSSPLYKVPVPPESPCTRCQRGLCDAARAGTTPLTCAHPGPCRHVSPCTRCQRRLCDGARAGTPPLTCQPCRACRAKLGSASHLLAPVPC